MTALIGKIPAIRISMIGLVFLVAPILASAQQRPDPLSREVVKHGEEIYAKSCTFCHGEEGRGSSAPRLSGRGFDAQYIERIITYGVPETSMPAWGQRLIAPDLVGVIGYVKSLNGITLPPDASSMRTFSGDTARGRDLFLDVTQELGSCTNCHAVGGKGVNMAPPLKNVPPGAAALRGIATPQLKTAAVNGETFPVIVASQLRDETKLYDLTTVPPVLRSFPTSAVKLTDGGKWQHSTVLGTYSNSELDLILTYLRAVIQP